MLEVMGWVGGTEIVGRGAVGVVSGGAVVAMGDELWHQESE